MTRSDLLAREPLPLGKDTAPGGGKATGEARLYRGTMTERVFDIEIGARLLSAPWDPRETGVYLLVLLDRWTDPADPLEAADREAVIDGLWALVPASGGVRAILEEVPALSSFLALRWDRGDDGFLVRIHSPTEVELLRLGRTMRAPIEVDANLDARGHRVARLGPRERARWILPSAADVTPAEWTDASNELAAAGPDDFCLTDPGWSIAAGGATEES